MEKDINGKGPNIEKYGSLTGELVKTTIGPTPEALTIKLQKATIELEASLKSVKEAKERLQASEYANAQLISEVDLLKKRTRTIAHDMRGPFNSLMGFSNTLQEGGLDEETEKMCINSIVLSAEKGFDLCNDLLSLNTESTPESINIYNNTDDNFHFCREAAKAKDIQLLYEIDPKTTVFSDRKMLNIILRNLVNNAIKFTKNKGTVTVTALEEDEYIRISVKDTGVGMSENMLTEFSQEHHLSSHPGTNNETGNGYGLSICQDYIKKLGGKFSIESKVGEGSTLSFTIPKKAPEKGINGKVSQIIEE